MTAFDSVTGMSLSAVRKEVDFPTLRENLITEDSVLSVGRDSVIRQDTMETLGIISKRRGELPYSTIMDWMVGEFENTNFDFKLKESLITNKGDMYQQYLFDIDTDNPDKEDISPMVIAKASYIGKPLEMMFGTYRFVCSNGAIVGNTIDSISISGREISDLMSNSVRDEISMNFDGMRRVSAKYRELENTPYEGIVNQMITDRKFPTGLKKRALYNLVDDGTLVLNLEEDDVKLKGEHFETANPETLYSTVSPKSAWSFYNNLTEISTHSSRSVSSRTHSGMAISRLFGI